MRWPLLFDGLTQPAGVSTGKPRTLTNIESVVERQQHLYQQSISASGKAGPIVMRSKLHLAGTRFSSQRAAEWFLPSAGYGAWDGVVTSFSSWDTFFAATMASIGDRDLAYADAIETLQSPRNRGLYQIMRGRAVGKALTDRSLRSGRLQCLAYIKSSTTIGFWRRHSSLCFDGIDGGLRIAMSRDT